MRVVVVVPTYNEAKNIGRLIDEVNAQAVKMQSHELLMLVVDDTSPDGTYKIVQEKQRQYSFLYLLLRTEKVGLGAAYVSGFKYAMQKLGADVIMEMDADFQHDPNDIPKFVEAIDKGADYVIGSRYIQGGGIPKEWGFHRKFLSVVGNKVAQFVLGIFHLTEFTNGFRASRVKGFVDTIDLDNILSKGFAYKLDLLFKMHLLGAKIVEIPVMFANRTEGVSKMETNNPIDSLRVVITLRARKEKNFIKFGLVGFAGFVIDSLGFNLIFLVDALSSYAALISGFIAMLSTLVLNNYWSFRDRTIGGSKEKVYKTGLYFLSSTIPIIIRNFLVEWGRVTFADTFIVRNMLFLVGVAFGLIWNFTVYSRIIWKDKKEA